MTPVTVASIRDALTRRDPVTASPAGRTQAAVAVLLAPADAGLDLLLIRRAEREGDPWSGQMGLPGGRRDDADANLVATAMRETREEIGVDLAAAELLGQLDDLAPTIQHLPRMLVRPYVFALERPPSFALSDEVAETVWAGMHDLRERLVEETLEIRDWRRTVQGYRIGPNLVWGMTERILTPFLELAGAGS